MIHHEPDLIASLIQALHRIILKHPLNGSEKIIFTV